MQTAVGLRIGPYEVTSALGAGGMGEVYRARDSRLGRDVAIKILPSSCADDADRLRRFEQEARTAGGLNHPNLLVLFDVGTHDGTPYLVSELLDGETLRSALARMPLGLRKAVDYGVQIARGLAAAHDKGIVHRDLKPENLFVTVDGRVKILDFGLARVTKSARPSVAGAENATHSTEPGVLLGTLAYMSPEQVRAQPADHRADVFAFGAVMFEMVAGLRAFGGDSAADTAAAILHQEPWEALGTDRAMPAGLERIVRRCLEKNPTERFQSASDLAFALEALSSSTVAGPVTTDRAVSERGHLSWAWACAGATLGALAVGGFMAPSLRRAPDRMPAPVVRSLVSVEPAKAFGGGERPEEQWIGGFVTSLALSPDGRRLAFVGRRGEIRQLYLRELDQERATLLPGTDAAENPFFSPDGEWIGFWARDQLFKIARRGGPAVALCSLPDPILGASWEPQDRIVFAKEVGGLWQVPSDGGEPRALTTLGAGELSHRLPHVLPGGDAVLFTVKTVWGGWERDARIAVESLRTHERRVLVDSAADARYVASGHLVFVRLGSLMAVPFDAERREVTGGVIGLAEGVAQAAQLPDYDDDSGAGQFDVASSGTLAYVPGGPRPLALASLVRVGRRGTVTDLSAPARGYTGARLSPDGRRLATKVRDRSGSGIWVFDIARTTMMPFDRGAMPIWSADGRELVFTGEDNDLFRRRADASAPAALLLKNPNYPTASSWSPDGKTLAIVQFTPTSAGGSQTDVLLLDMTHEESASRPLLVGPSDERHPEFSPDGRWLAYVSNESGRREVYVQPFPGTGAKLQVSIEGGTNPAWARTGGELFYLAPLAGTRMRMMFVEFTAAPRLSVSRPRALFEFDNERLSMRCDPVRCYDVAPDGQGFLAVQVHQASPTPVVTHIDLVQNWLDDLKSRAPSGRQ